MDVISVLHKKSSSQLNPHFFQIAFNVGRLSRVCYAFGMSLLVEDLLDLKQTDHASLFQNCKYPWEALSKIESYLEDRLRPGCFGKVHPSAVLEGIIFIGEGTVIEPNVYIRGPAWIGKNCQIRQGAYLRGFVIAGDDCVLGNSCEFKNSILFHKAQVPHFAYVGDSILGHRAHLGSGVTLSNLKITSGNVKVIVQEKSLDSGLRKFGAILGDRSEVGCHCVLNPGSVLGRDSVLYPGVSWRGVCEPHMVVKLKQEHLQVSRTR